MPRGKAKPAAKPAATAPAKAKAATNLPVIALKSSALSPGVGMSAVNMLSQAWDNKRQIKSLQQANTAMVGNRGKAQVDLAIAFWKGQLADPTLDLIQSVTGNKAEKDQLSARAGMLVGLREIVDGKYEWTKEARAALIVNDTDDDDTKDKKNSVRTNLSTMITKAMRVALHAVENGIVFDKDKATGLLRITDGKKGTGAVKSRFGETSVVLNEREDAPILDKKGQKVGVKPLKAKASFSEMIRALGESHNVDLEPKRAGTGGTGPSASDPETHLVEVCGNLVKSIAKISGEPSDKVRKALESLRSAIDNCID